MEIRYLQRKNDSFNFEKSNLNPVFTRFKMLNDFSIVHVVLTRQSKQRY